MTTPRTHKKTLTTQHTFTFGPLRTVFEYCPPEPSVGFRGGYWELTSCAKAGGVEIELDALCAELAARGEEFTPESLTDLLWQEAEREGITQHVAKAA